ncbi:growth factor receptor-bound protein 14-like protein [Leptotrombidium deliense]|uniref:Growth factor receptor-bound protein 14-like protein n=1 Tax=Leptotrombidium deliense TaxID=299467 RepID=A0A443SWJ2_9ACAR|nr:growth factor receptor-bound protein 14-like protein [Leptotrombidium deliense]
MNQRVDYSAQDFTGDMSQVSIETVKERRKVVESRSQPSDTERHADRSMLHLSEPWFYSQMSRKESTQCLLKYANVDGVFLVRPSQRNPGSFVLSFTSKERINHVPILVTEDSGQISLSLDCGRTKFYDLKQLVEFYQLNIGCLPTKLTHFLVHR